MKSLLILVGLVYLAECQMDNMEFLIYSRKHYLRHLVISGGTMYFNKDRLYNDAFFKFKESTTNPGFYTLESSEHQNHFLCVRWSNSQPIPYYKRHARPDNTCLFSFIPMKSSYPSMATECPGCYYIKAKNCGNGRHCCLRVDANNQEPLKAHTNCDYGNPQKLGIFELKARFNPRIKTTVYDVDLRHLPKSAKPLKREVTLEYGVSTTLEKTYVQKTTIKGSFEASISATIEVLSLGATYGLEVTSEIETSLKQSHTEYWKRTETETYYFEAGYRTKILHHVVEFDSAMEGDNVMSVESGVKVVATDQPGDFQTDEEKEFAIEGEGIWGNYYTH